MMVTWMIALLAAGAGYETAPRAPGNADSGRDATTSGQARPRLVPPRTFNLAGQRNAEYRLSALSAPIEDAKADSPLHVSAVEDDRQRLRFGVKPGLRRARIGFDYRLALGD